MFARTACSPAAGGAPCPGPCGVPACSRRGTRCPAPSTQTHTVQGEHPAVTCECKTQDAPPIRGARLGEAASGRGKGRGKPGHQPAGGHRSGGSALRSLSAHLLQKVNYQRVPHELQALPLVRLEHLHSTRRSRRVSSAPWGAQGEQQVRLVNPPAGAQAKGAVLRHQACGQWSLFLPGCGRGTPANPPGGCSDAAGAAACLAARPRAVPAGAPLPPPTSLLPPGQRCQPPQPPAAPAARQPPPGCPHPAGAAGADPGAPWQLYRGRSWAAAAGLLRQPTGMDGQQPKRWVLNGTEGAQAAGAAKPGQASAPLLTCGWPSPARHTHTAPPLATLSAKLAPLPPSRPANGEWGHARHVMRRGRCASCVRTQPYSRETACARGVGWVGGGEASQGGPVAKG